MLVSNGTKYSRMNQVKFFKGCLPQILLDLFLNTWTPLMPKYWNQFHYQTVWFCYLNIITTGQLHQYRVFLWKVTIFTLICVVMFDLSTAKTIYQGQTKAAFSLSYIWRHTLFAIFYKKTLSPSHFSKSGGMCFLWISM